MHLIEEGRLVMIATLLLQLTSVPRSSATKVRAGSLRSNASVFALLLAALAAFAPRANAVPQHGAPDWLRVRALPYGLSGADPVRPAVQARRLRREFQKWDARPLLERLPVAAALQISQTNTNNTSAGGAMPSDFPRDRELLLQTLALYYGGQITQNSGALVQYNYDGVERRWGMEMFDARYAKGFSVADKEVTVGVTLNNSPTVSDIYNSTPSWSFPHTDSVAPAMPASTVIDMMLASQVGGVTAYGMWNDLIYAEAGVYRTAARGALRIWDTAYRPTQC